MHTSVYLHPRSSTAPQLPRIGILGGTFNPIHCGHMEMARTARDEFRLQQVWLMPTRQPPHKRDTLISAAHRMRMVEVACEGESDLVASDVELLREGTTYTVDTMRYLHQNRPADYFFIIGGDTVLELHTWYEFEEVMRLCKFIVFLRKGVPEEPVQREIAHLQSCYGAQFHISQHSCQQISSTQIRQMAQRGQSLTHLVPQQVEAYIRRHEVYHAVQ